MVKLNNVVRVNTTNVKDFFVKWFVFLKPFHNLTNKEIDVMATFLKYRYELLSKSDDPNLRNLIKNVNELGIQKDDIVSLVKDHESYVLIYYKANE